MVKTRKQIIIFIEWIRAHCIKTHISTGGGGHCSYAYWLLIAGFLNIVTHPPTHPWKNTPQERRKEEGAAIDKVLVAVVVVVRTGNTRQMTSALGLGVGRIRRCFVISASVIIIIIIVIISIIIALFYLRTLSDQKPWDLLKLYYCSRVEVGCLSKGLFILLAD